MLITRLNSLRGEFLRRHKEPKVGTEIRKLRHYPLVSGFDKVIALGSRGVHLGGRPDYTNSP